MTVCLVRENEAGVTHFRTSPAGRGLECHRWSLSFIITKQWGVVEGFQTRSDDDRLGTAGQKTHQLQGGPPGEEEGHQLEVTGGAQPGERQKREQEHSSRFPLTKQESSDDAHVSLASLAPHWGAGWGSGVREAMPQCPLS